MDPSPCFWPKARIYACFRNSMACASSQDHAISHRLWLPGFWDVTYRACKLYGFINVCCILFSNLYFFAPVAVRAVRCGLKVRRCR